MSESRFHRLLTNLRPEKEIAQEAAVIFFLSEEVAASFANTAQSDEKGFACLLAGREGENRNKIWF